MINIEFANAYSEVLEILKYISKEDYEKIPISKIQLFETNQNKEYIFEYNPNKTLEEQNVSKRAKAIIGLLFRDYWATDEQKEKIIRKQNYDRQIIEEQKKSKYDVENIFKKKSLESEIEIKEKATEMVVYRENIFKKIFNKLINFIRRK